MSAIGLFRSLITPAPTTPAQWPGVEFHDRRKYAAQSHHGYPVRSRSIKRVQGICLHQTACLMGERPDRYDGGGAHVFLSRSGRVVWLHDWTSVVVAANGWNAGTVSVEIDGLYRGVEDDPRSVWDNPATPERETGMELTDAAVKAAIEVVRWIKADVDARGGCVTKLVAHRQASAQRRSDPGEAIWKRIALPVSAELVLDDGGPGFTLGDGRAIPEEWDPARKGWRY